MGRLRGVIWMNTLNEGKNFITGLGRKMQLSPLTKRGKDSPRKYIPLENRPGDFSAIESDIFWGGPNKWALSQWSECKMETRLQRQALIPWRRKDKAEMRIRPAPRAENWNVQGQIQSANPCLASTRGLVPRGSSSARQREPFNLLPLLMTNMLRLASDQEFDTRSLHNKPAGREES